MAWDTNFIFNYISCSMWGYKTLVEKHITKEIRTEIYKIMAL